MLLFPIFLSLQSSPSSSSKRSFIFCAIFLHASPLEACLFLNGIGEGADGERGRWEKGRDRRRGERGNWLECKINENNVN